MIFVFLSARATSATPNHDQIEVKFIHALMKQNKALAQSYLENDVAIPTPKEEDRSIASYSIRPSGKKDAVILVGYFHGKNGDLEGELIDFIWQLTLSKNKITDIEVYY